MQGTDEENIYIANQSDITSSLKFLYLRICVTKLKE
jgi:hypothetical protein